MATTDLSKMTAAERIALAADLARFQERDKKLTELVDEFKSSLAEAEIAVADVIPLLVPPKPRGRPAGKKVAAKKSVGVKKPKAAKSSIADGLGGKPIPGTTYVHPDTGQEWTKHSSGKGAPKKEFAALIASGKTTWSELVKHTGHVQKRSE